ncbi:Transcriptional regulator, LysR family protein [Oleispira antarctica RB-8]|uniref:Transcriptional regulator, LysR family protein n=1 Tax=Oleispira antarctica RB-8 TaxID=698738 RepID=R4YJG7_OLEAN|nr:Transcriptional regulator, LysR family protein [Oleispira antarctica RB-8]|tara:strand:- start:1278 stop:2189 length:912 start_codon:yes stop_codon:yes gene_type:complete
MKLDNLKLFVKTLQAGSVTQAAKDLGMPKSSLSRHLTDLETEFNIRLLDRRPRNLSATEAGQLLYNQAAPLMEGLDDVSQFMEGWRKEPRGSLKILLPQEFFNQQIGQLTIEFMSQYKDICLTINHYSGELPSNNRDYDLTFAVHDSPLPASDLIVRELMSLPQGIYCSPHCATQITINELNDLSNYQVIRENNESSWQFLKKQDQKQSKQAERVSISVVGRLNMNSAEMRLIGAIRGMGMIKLPQYIADQQLRLGALKQVSTPFPLEAQTVSVLYPTRMMPRKTKTFLDFIQDNIGRLQSIV